MQDYEKIADILYREQNPQEKMDTPASVYETVKKWYIQYSAQIQQLPFYDWVKLNKK